MIVNGRQSNFAKTHKSYASGQTINQRYGSYGINNDENTPWFLPSSHTPVFEFCKSTAPLLFLVFSSTAHLLQMNTILLAILVFALTYISGASAQCYVNTDGQVCNGQGACVLNGTFCKCNDAYGNVNCTYKRKSQVAAFLLSFFLVCFYPFC